MVRNIVEEFRSSCLVERGFGGVGKRSDRYAPQRKIYGNGTHMAPMFKDLIFRTLNDLPLDPDGKYEEAVKNITHTAAHYFKYGVIAKYEDFIAVFFSGVPGLDICGLRLTYTDEEFNRTLEFVSKTKNSPILNAFLAFALDYLMKVQNINLIKQLPTYGVIYQFSVNERYRYFSNSCARIIHFDENAGCIDTAAYNAAQSALYDRNVPLEELEAILPDGPEAKLFARKYVDFELAQIECLERHIAAEA